MLFRFSFRSSVVSVSAFVSHLSVRRNEKPQMQCATLPAKGDEETLTFVSEENEGVGQGHEG